MGTSYTANDTEKLSPAEWAILDAAAQRHHKGTYQYIKALGESSDLGSFFIAAAEWAHNARLKAGFIIDGRI